jgi:hypothetical protein
MTESKLSYLLTRFTPEQRDELCRRLGIGTDTFYRRRNDPGTFTLDEADVLDQYLEELSGAPVDTYRLYRDVVEVPALCYPPKANEAA